MRLTTPLGVFNSNASVANCPAGTKTRPVPAPTVLLRQGE